jgi:hypothetical protein
MYSNFSVQDFRAIRPQRYDTQEFLSPTDTSVIMVRRMYSHARGNPLGQVARSLTTTPAEEAAAQILKKDFGTTPEWEQSETRK